MFSGNVDVRRGTYVELLLLLLLCVRTIKPFDSSRQYLFEVSEAPDRFTASTAVQRMPLYTISGTWYTVHGTYIPGTAVYRRKQVFA